MAWYLPLSQALHEKVGFETIEVIEPTPRQVQFKGRLPSVRMGDMLLLIVALHTFAAEGVIGVEIGKIYIIKGGSPVFYWRVIFQSKSDASIKSLINSCLQAIKTSKHSARRELEEFPLVGASPNRNQQSATGKGAGLLGKMRLGPSAKYLRWKSTKRRSLSTPPRRQSRSSLRRRQQRSRRGRRLSTRC